MPRNDSLEALHPAVHDKFVHLSDLLVTWRAAGKLHSTFACFETYRTPEDQQEAYARGVSKARAWQSPHQYGFAADFVALDGDEPGKWSWSDKHDWNGLKAAARFVGLDCPITWDRPHVQSPLWVEARAGLRRK